MRTSIVPIYETIVSLLTTGPTQVVRSPDLVWLIRKRKDLPDSFIGYPAICLQFSGMKPDQASAAGMGRSSSWVTRHLTVYVISREDLDPYREDSHRLLEEIDGHFFLEDRVNSALQLLPAVTDPVTLENRVVEPVRLVAASDATEGVNKSYTVSTLVYEIIYETNLDQDYEALFPQATS